MADGDMTLKLDADTARLLKERADAEGVTPEQVVSRWATEHAVDFADWPPRTRRSGPRDRPSHRTRDAWAR